MSSPYHAIAAIAYREKYAVLVRKCHGLICGFPPESYVCSDSLICEEGLRHHGVGHNFPHLRVVGSSSRLRDDFDVA
jgi:hypothetical protein